VIELRKLRYFVTVADERSFSGASKRLNIAQPPLSRQIREIEDEIGVCLIDRSSRPFSLTPAGQLFYEQAVQIIHGNERLKATMEDFIQSRRPRLALGVAPSGFHLRLPHFIRHFRRASPDVAFSIHEMDTAEQIAALMDGRINVGFDRTIVVEDDIRCLVLRDEQLVLAAPVTYRPAVSEPIDIHTLTEETLILYSRKTGQSYAETVLNLFRRHGVTPRSQITVQEVTTALSLVAANMGISIVPISARTIGHPETQFHTIKQHATCPVTMLIRDEPPSPAIRKLFVSLEELYTEWGFPPPVSKIDNNYRPDDT